VIPPVWEATIEAKLQWGPRYSWMQHLYLNNNIVVGSIDRPSPPRKIWSYNLTGRTNNFAPDEETAKHELLMAAVKALRQHTPTDNTK